MVIFLNVNLGRDRAVFLFHHPQLTNSVARIESESNSGFEDNYDNDEMEVDQSEADLAIPENIRT